MQQLTCNPTENTSTKIYGNQQSIYDINNQHQELDKGTLMENTLKCTLNSQQLMNVSLILTRTEATLKTTIQKF